MAVNLNGRRTTDQMMRLGGVDLFKNVTCASTKLQYTARF